MSLRLAAIAPHSPLLIPSIGKNNSSRLEKTLNSYKKIGDFISSEGIDSVLIISPHGNNGQSFGVNVSPELSVNFEDFGDFSSKTKIDADLETIERIREPLIAEGVGKAVNKPSPDFGFAVPIYLLFRDRQEIEVILINASSDLSSKDHFEAGVTIGKILEKSNRRFAVISSSDLSHRLDKSSPAGYSPKGQKFDLRLIDLIHEKRVDDILNLDENIIKEAKPCGLGAISMLFGVLSGAQADWDMITSTYEAPFGIGYLTASLGIKKTAD